MVVVDAKKRVLASTEPIDCMLRANGAETHKKSQLNIPDKPATGETAERRTPPSILQKAGNLSIGPALPANAGQA